MNFEPDINENDILTLGAEVLEALLRDHTTGANIFWATADYEHLGEKYSYKMPILPELVTGENNKVVMPRVLKSKEQRSLGFARKTPSPQHSTSKLGSALDKSLTLGNLRARSHCPRLIAIFGSSVL